MSERKVLNKYFPPNFDPNKIPKRKHTPKDDQHKVRLMSPFSMRCNTCGDYIYKGRKFNARKEPAQGERYLSIKIYRFYIRCPRCSAEITFKTDPEHCDYVAEHGATRNFEPWREAKALEEELKMQREADEAYDPMKALENRTVDSKREIDILEALDEIRTLKARFEKQDVDEARMKVLQDTLSEAERARIMEAKLQEEEDDEIIKSVFGKGNSNNNNSEDEDVEDEDDEEDELKGKGIKIVKRMNEEEDLALVKQRHLASISDLKTIKAKKPLVKIIPRSKVEKTTPTTSKPDETKSSSFSLVDYDSE